MFIPLWRHLVFLAALFLFGLALSILDTRIPSNPTAMFLVLKIQSWSGFVIAVACAIEAGYIIVSLGRMGRPIHPSELRLQLGDKIRITDQSLMLVVNVVADGKSQGQKIIDLSSDPKFKGVLAEVIASDSGYWPEDLENGEFEITERL